MPVRRRSCWAFVLVLCVSASARGRTLMEVLSASFSGQKVIAAGYGFRGGALNVDPGGLDPEKPLLDRLQTFATAASKEDDALIPYGIGTGYVLAPEVREDVRLEMAGASPVDALSEAAAVDRAISLLTPEQVHAFCTPEGVAVSSLSDDARAALQRAFRPPLRMPDGSVREAPLDWAQVRIRGYWRLKAALAPIPEPPYHWFAERRGERPGIEPAHLSSPFSNVVPPATQDAPGKFKPSDLAGLGRIQPIGISGAHTVEEVVARLAKVTGLSLRVMSLYRAVPVFVGSPDLTCGEVIDGLRLSLSGAWRKLGNDYILTWDRRGLGALQQMVAEAGQATTGAAWDMEQEAENSPVWVRLAVEMPFDPEDPLALTPEQQRKLFDVAGNGPTEQTRALQAARDAAIRSMDPAAIKAVYEMMEAGRQRDEIRLPFSDLTPAQQAFLRETARREAPTNGAFAGQRFLAPDEVEKICLYNVAAMRLNLKLPESGWVPAGSFGYGEIDGTKLRVNLGFETSRREREEKLRQAAGKPADPEPEPPKPVEVTAKVRGLLLPAMGPAHVAEIAAAMKRHGLNTLFYPVLFDGYATFPTGAFPLHPALRGKDGWAAAQAVASTEGLTLIGYFDTLAWQSVDDPVHWLREHPDWVDVDILGRSRQDWISARPLWATSPPEGVVNGYNFVRPSEPQVGSRLEALLDAFAKKPGSSGVAFLDWKPLGQPGVSIVPQAPPPLGYSVPDRIAALRTTGEDPVDEPADIPTMANSFWPRAFAALGIPKYPPASDVDPQRPNPWRDLAQKLLRRAKSLRPDWTTYLARNRKIAFPDPSNRNPDKETLHADQSLVSALSLSSRDSGLLLPVWPRSAMPAKWSEAHRRYPAITDLIPRDRDSGGTAKVVVFDFRAAPDEVLESLRWVLPPKR